MSSFPGTPFPFPEFSSAAAEDDPSVIFALDEDLKFLYCNRAWDTFAGENGGVGLERAIVIGRCILESISPALQGYYQAAYQRALRSKEPWQHAYECSSASVYRKYWMHVLPARRAAGLLIVNSLQVERPHESSSFPPLDDLYRDPLGRIVMCSHCRRTRRRSSNIWDWVPGYVAHQPSAVSHGLCEPCLDYYYPPEP